jgi:hypothetical protein
MSECSQNAVMQETLRPHPPAAMCQEKVAPNEDLRVVTSGDNTERSKCSLM